MMNMGWLRQRLSIFKSGDKKLISNYRPISVLYVFSKVSERVMYTRVIDYLAVSDVLHCAQFGFRQKLSTSSVSSRRLRGGGGISPPPPTNFKFPPKKTQQTTMLCSGINGAPIPLSLKSPPPSQGVWMKH